ncbi:MAG: Hpt domain-containing protein [Terracidiphilus sp.]
MGDAQVSLLAEAINRLWAKYLPQMEERVETLQNAAENLANGTLTTKEQKLAGADAHKLAGVLGTFGLKEGTELAREAEGLYGSSLDADPAAASRLRVIAEELRSMIANRN